MNQYPDKENTLALLGDWQKHHAAVKHLLDGIAASPIGLNTSGVMYLTVWNLFDAYTSTLSVEVGDFDEWLECYLEYGMGARVFEAGYKGKTRKIKTLAHLYWLIEESRKRGVQS